MNTEHIKRAWQKLNREMFDKMLDNASFNVTTRGKTPIRYAGNGMYIVHLGVDITDNDIIVEMCYHLDNKVHRDDCVPTKQTMLEALSRGYIETGESKIVHRAQAYQVRGTRQKKWTCGCTIVRCAVDLQASCNVCNKPFIKEDA